MYTVSGTTRGKPTVEQLQRELERLNARLEELERGLNEKFEKIQTEVAADLKRVELRLDDLERQNKKVLVRLEVAERRLQFEASALHRPDIGFDKIGIA